MRSLSFVVPGLMFLSAGLATPVLAADLGPPPLEAPPAAADPQMEFGNSWYLRGDIGAVLETVPKISNDLNLIGDSKRRVSMSADAGFGYKLNNWLRADVIGEYRTTRSRSGFGGQIQCPTGAVVNGGVSVLTYSTCDVNGYSKLSHWNVLANAYVDLGNWSGLTPYLGAGAGITHMTARGSTAYTINPAGTPYKPTIVDPVSGLSTTYNFDRVQNTGGTTRFAWNVMAGLGYALNDHATLDLGYRYLDMGRYTGLPDYTGAVHKKELTSHEVRLGVRYMID